MPSHLSNASDEDSLLVVAAEVANILNEGEGQVG